MRDALSHEWSEWQYFMEEKLWMMSGTSAIKLMFDAEQFSWSWLICTVQHRIREIFIKMNKNKKKKN